jgi:hypothetical protein
MPNEEQKSEIGDQKSADFANNELIAVLGGIEIEIKHKPESAFDEAELKELEKFLPLLGTTEKIMIRQIRARDIPAYHRALGQEEICAELFCRKEAGWAATLDYDSFEKVMDTGQDLNLPFWSAWFRRWQAREKATAPGMANIVEKMLAEAAARIATKPSPSPSPGSSPTSG